jgi:uncharacterized membrane protein YeaQ/YmgE (transglycosylase-associated protein family)
MDVLVLSLAGGLVGVLFAFLARRARQGGSPWVPITVGVVGGVVGGCVVGPLTRFMTKSPAFPLGGVNGFDLVFALLVAFLLLWTARRASARYTTTAPA